MLAVKIRRVLIFFRNGQQLCFAEQFTEEADARGRAGGPEAVGHDHARMPGEISEQEAVARLRRRDDDVHARKNFGRVLNQQVANPLRPQGFDDRDEAQLAKCAGPPTRCFAG